VHLILRALDMGGRADVIVPDGVLFGSSRAHVELRKKLVEENRLDGALSMPSGVFKPYAGVSTAVLFFTRGAQTKNIWFYDMAHDGFSLDDKRQKVDENDIPDALACWEKRLDPDFQSTRRQRIEALREELVPLKAERMELWEQIDDLSFQQFVNENIPDYHPLAGGVSVEAGPPEEVNPQLAEAKAALEKVEAQIAPLQSELEQLSRQFWVGAEQVRANKYDLSAGRYRQQEPEERYLPNSDEVIKRLMDLNELMDKQLFNLLSDFEDSIFPNDYESDPTEGDADDIPF
jgi:type I restriction enzyme M protein